MRIGIPRALLYYHDFPIWEAFFKNLGHEVVVSPPTNEQTVVTGCSSVTGEICLPVKVFCGHVQWLKKECDCLFIPAVHSMEKKVYNCPKLIGLPDLTRARISDLPPVLDPDIDVNQGEKGGNKAVDYLTRALGQRRTTVRQAIIDAMAARASSASIITGNSTRMAAHRSSDAMTIAIIGHRYIVQDTHINHRLVDRLGELGVQTVFAEDVGQRELHAAMLELTDSKYWSYEQDIVGAGAYYLKSKVDGIIALECFGCGPDSLMIEFVERAARRSNRPLLKLVLDEHSADGGLLTRIEAFVDMMQRVKIRPTSTAIRLVPPQPSNGHLTKVVGLPNMGVVGPAFRNVAEQMGVSVVIPPVTKRTISLGARYSPEFACLPFKAFLGTFIECLDQGADTLFMVTSTNACRMGYYARVQEHILLDMGYNFRFFRRHTADKGLIGVLKIIRRISNDAPWRKVIAAYRLGTARLKALDDLERKVALARAIELEPGTGDAIRKEATNAIEQTDSLSQLKKVVRFHFGRLDNIPRNPNAEPLRVAIVGEMYVVAEPCVNFNIEMELGKMGVIASRSRSTYLSEWTNPLSYMRVLTKDKQRLAKCASPYLKRDIGGHGLESIGEKIRLGHEGYDGVVHLAPLTCMPEVVAQNILPVTGGEIPVLTMTCDEQLSVTGVVTRLEAFVDLLRRRRDYTRLR